MDRISLKNFRCFREVKDVPLAPLTLLVGENSTGKTSFMAMLRALWDVASHRLAPDFKEEPYDLGSFDEIAHYRGGRGGKADTFEIGCEIIDSKEQDILCLKISFKKRGTVPYLTRKCIFRKDETAWIEYKLEEGQNWRYYVGTKRGAWEIKQDGDPPFSTGSEDQLFPIWLLLRHWGRTKISGRNTPGLVPARDSNKVNPNPQDLGLIKAISEAERGFPHFRKRPYASAPVRSKPRRTYDPSRLTRDPEGTYIPMYLANIHYRNKVQWKKLKDALEMFGKMSGLFDEISIKSLGKKESEPFQVQIRKFGNKSKGPSRNLIDVGYGISQALPFVTELLRDDTLPMLLQQPEVHLHPSAQAALGSLFCNIATPRRRLVIETHSDHLLDRVRMDVRDGEGNLKPEDVSILFFERQNLDVQIHPIHLDEKGNVLRAPPSYRRFFMEETSRSIGL